MPVGKPEPLPHRRASGEHSLPMPVSVPLLLDLGAVLVGGLTGALLAVRKRFDLVGCVSLAIVAGVGGGIIRDVLLQRGPPAALLDSRYLVTALIAAAVGFYRSGDVARISRALNAVDAVNLGVFTVVGALKALTAGLARCRRCFLASSPPSGAGSCATCWPARPRHCSRPASSTPPSLAYGERAVRRLVGVLTGAAHRGGDHRHRSSWSCCGCSPCDTGGARPNRRWTHPAQDLLDPRGRYSFGGGPRFTQRTYDRRHREDARRQGRSLPEVRRPEDPEAAPAPPRSRLGGSRVRSRATAARACSSTCSACTAPAGWRGPATSRSCPWTRASSTRPGRASRRTRTTSIPRTS